MNRLGYYIFWIMMALSCFGIVLGTAKSTFIVCDKLGYVDICQVKFVPFWLIGDKDGKN